MVQLSLCLSAVQLDGTMCDAVVFTVRTAFFCLRSPRQQANSHADSDVVIQLRGYVHNYTGEAEGGGAGKVRLRTDEVYRGGRADHLER